MSKKTGVFAVQVDAIVVSGSRLKGLRVENFTGFKKENFKFSPHLNIVLGENGTGKSHLIKLAYSLIAANVEGYRKYKDNAPTKQLLQTELSNKLITVFKPETLGHLVKQDFSKKPASPKTICEVEAEFYSTEFNFALNLKSGDQNSLSIHGLPERWLGQPPIFIPTRELLTLYPGFLSVYESRFLEFEEIYRDLSILLGLPPLKELKPAFKNSLSEIEKLMGGKIFLDKNGRFYLKFPGGKMLEMPLVAEGIRKLAMIAQLFANGSFQEEGIVFWDEPEANLNPKLIKEIAPLIIDLCSQGIQVFIATHSLFLMRELEILLKDQKNKSIYTRIIGLSRKKNEFIVEQADNFDDIQNVVSLDEELLQSDRFMEAFND